MPRPKKCRRVCRLPQHNAFGPMCQQSIPEEICMTIDEYETIRLIDHQGFTQEQCSQYMGIARTTVQQIYDRARKKLASALVEGKKLRIEGGDYQLCDGTEARCGCAVCWKREKQKEPF